MKHLRPSTCCPGGYLSWTSVCSSTESFRPYACASWSVFPLRCVRPTISEAFLRAMLLCFLLRRSKSYIDDESVAECRILHQCRKIHCRASLIAGLATSRLISWSSCLRSHRPRASLETHTCCPMCVSSRSSYWHPRLDSFQSQSGNLLRLHSSPQ